MNKRKQMIKRRQHWLSKYKVAKGCSNCGYNEYALALDFAHIDPSLKSKEITKHGPCGSGIGKLYGRISLTDPIKNRKYLHELMDEIRKCKILCKNCHVKETFLNREMHNSWKTYKERNEEKIKENTLEEFFE
jgi:hypothetical protein